MVPLSPQFGPSSTPRGPLVMLGYGRGPNLGCELSLSMSSARLGRYSISDIQAIYDQALAEFDAKLQQLTTRDICGQSYVRTPTLKKWLLATSNAHTPGYPTTTNVELPVRASYDGKNRRKFLPIQSAIIASRGPHCSLVVFSILLELGHKNLIHVFVESSVVDRLLPFDFYHLRDRLAHELPRVSVELLEKFHA